MKRQSLIDLAKGFEDSNPLRIPSHHIEIILEVLRNIPEEIPEICTISTVRKRKDLKGISFFSSDVFLENSPTSVRMRQDVYLCDGDEVFNASILKSPKAIRKKVYINTLSPGKETLAVLCKGVERSSMSDFIIKTKKEKMTVEKKIRRHMGNGISIGKQTNCLLSCRFGDKIRILTGNTKKRTYEMSYESLISCWPTFYQVTECGEAAKAFSIQVGNEYRSISNNWIVKCDEEFKRKINGFQK